jgi:hypothetical protein
VSIATLCCLWSVLEAQTVLIPFCIFWSITADLNTVISAADVIVHDLHTAKAAVTALSTR